MRAMSGNTRERTEQNLIVGVVSDSKAIPLGSNRLGRRTDIPWEELDTREQTTVTTCFVQSKFGNKRKSKFSDDERKVSGGQVG